MEASEAIGKYYWAMAPRDRLGVEVRAAFDRYHRELERRAWTQRITSSWLRYHGTDSDGGPATSADVIPGGEQGELNLVQANHYRSIVESMLSLATSSRPAFRAAATDDSAESMAACHLAEQVWEHELERGLEAVAREGGERMLVESETGILVVWDTERGDVVGTDDVHELDEDGNPVMDEVPALDPATGQPALDPLTGAPVMQQAPRVIDKRPIYSGDLVYEALGPLDIARDLQLRGHREIKWVVIRRVMSRWDLCATYTSDDAVREIMGASGPPTESGGSEREHGSTAPAHGDQCYVLELYHESTPAVPGGRYARVVGDYVLEESELPYSRIPVVIKAPASVLGKPIGYTKAWDLLGVAKLLDAALSNMASTADRHGQRPVLLPKGSDIGAASLTGPSVIDCEIDSTTGRMVEPKWMEVPKIDQAEINYFELLQGQMQVLSGVNSVVRGDPEASLKSGAALALVQAMAVQHNSAFQAEYAELLRDLATLVIDLYRENARTERTIDIVGDDEIGTVAKFTGDALNSVRRVRAELANPLMRTIAGKKELADFLSEPKRWETEPPLTRTQYIGFLSSGRLDPLFRADRSEAIGIRAECEALTRGEPQTVLVTDCHEKHIREHKAILDGKQRHQLDPAAIEVVTAHINEHVTMWAQLTANNPTLLMATGQRPAPMPQPAGPPMGGPMPPGAPGMPPGGPPQGAPPPPPEAPGSTPLGPPLAGPAGETHIPGAGPPAAALPQAPINPATGQRATLPDGAMQ